MVIISCNNKIRKKTIDYEKKPENMAHCNALSALIRFIILMYNYPLPLALKCPGSLVLMRNPISFDAEIRR
jgi:hypothetical protein